VTYTNAVCTVKSSWWWTEELSGTCRVSFPNKFEKLAHLVGFIIRICHDTWSHERKIHKNILWYNNRAFHCLHKLAQTLTKEFVVALLTIERCKTNISLTINHWKSGIQWNNIQGDGKVKIAYMQLWLDQHLVELCRDRENLNTKKFRVAAARSIIFSLNIW